MKWTQMLALPIALCSLFLVFLLSVPVIYPHMIHTSPPLWMSDLRQSLLPGGAIADVQPYAWILFGCMIALYVLASVHVKQLNRPMTHGSSNYATRRMLRQFRVSRTPLLLRPLLWIAHTPAPLATRLQVLSALPHNAQLQRFSTTTALFFVGIYHHRLIALREKQQEEHMLITGPTGSRKSILLIIRNLLYEALTPTRSVFIADLKNELCRITAGAMARSHQVWRFTPNDPDRSHGYDPLAYVKDATDANMLADCWVRNTGESKDDPFWSTCARFLIASVILHLRTTEPDAPFSRVAQLITGKSFAQLKDILTQSPSQDARRKAANFLQQSEFE